MGKITAVTIKTDGALTVVKDFETGYESMQKAVGGYIEAVTLHEDKNHEITLWLNEEGKIHGLPPNFYLIEQSGRVLDIIVGDVLITATKNGETTSLSIQDIVTLRKKFKLNEPGLERMYIYR